MNSQNARRGPTTNATPGGKEGIDFDAVVKGAAAAIVTVDRGGCISSWNDAAEALLGYREAAVLGQPAPHIHPVGRAPAPGRHVASRIHRDGRTLYLQVAVATIRDGDGIAAGWSEILQPLPDDDTASTADDEAIASGLASAIQRGELHLLYQPVFRLHDRQPVGVEALLRWHRADGTVLLPDLFIPSAERVGLIGAIGMFVLRGACEQIAAWRRDGARALPVSVNVSAHQFRRPDFAAVFAAAISASGIDPRWLKLEITESAIVEDPATASARLDDLRAIGVGISIDDFGVGYSSLSRLRHYRIDTLKLDHSFVRDVADDAIAREVAGTIVRLAHRLGMTVVAEGIETEGQCTTLLELGCDCGQGFLLSRPLPGGEVAALT